jgi:diguanylate cyclase (GGDEF)-like protein
MDIKKILGDFFTTSPYKQRFLKYFLIVASPMFFFLSYYNYLNDYYFYGVIELLIGLMGISILIFFKNELYLNIASRITALLIIIFYIDVVFTSLNTPGICIFFSLFPILIFFLTNLKEGIFWTVVFLIVFAIALLRYFSEYGELPPNLEDNLFAVGVVFVLLTILAIFYEWNKNQYEEMLKKSAETDFLTDIFNRRKFRELLKKEIERSRRYYIPLSLISLDLDDFKEVNDNFGHKTGDYVLKELVRVIEFRIRETDIFARVGGEEFMILSPETTLEGAKRLAEDIRLSIAEHHFEDVGHITISLGVAEYITGNSPDTFINRADNQLYKAKKKGKNRVEAIE